jgi:hypothetical protein
MSPILVVFILLQLLGGIGILSVLGKGSLDRGDLFLIGIIIPTTITGLATIYRLWRHRMAVRDTVPIISSKTLVCSTPVDEAISLLRHAETASNPLDPGPSLFGYLRDVRRRYLQRQLDIERQHGLPLLWSSPILWRAVALTFYIWLTFTVLLIYVYWGYSVRARNLPDIIYAGLGWISLQTGLPVPSYSITMWVIYPMIVVPVLVVGVAIFYGGSFIAALAAPVRWIVRQLRIFAALLNEAVAYFVRKRIWEVLRTLLFGLEAYPRPRAALKLQMKPPQLDASRCRYEELSPHVIDRVIRERDARVAQRIGIATSLFSAEQIATKDVLKALIDIERDITLVHASYYTQEECIDRIALWIARRQ